MTLNKSKLGFICFKKKKCAILVENLGSKIDHEN